MPISTAACSRSTAISAATRALLPWTVFDDLRVAKRIHFTERYNIELITDMFNIANRNNVSAVSPLFTNAGQATAAYDPRQFQFALKFNW